MFWPVLYNYTFIAFAIVISSNQRCIYHAYTQRSSASRSFFQSDSSHPDKIETGCSTYKYFTQNQQCSKSLDLLNSVKTRVEDSIKNILGTNFKHSSERHRDNHVSFDGDIRESDRSKITDEITGAAKWTVSQSQII